jgi:hypothetical protein
VTSHSRIAGARLFSEVVTGDERRAMTLDSVPSEARPPDSHHPRPWGWIQDAWTRRGYDPPARSHLITICSMIKVGSVISSRASLAAPSDSLTTYLRSSRGSARRSPRSSAAPARH